MASINATTSSGIVATADNTGQLQLQSAGTTVMTITSTGVTTQVGAPAFSAYNNSTQSISSGAFTKVTFSSEDFDTNNNFDSTTNYRFTPTVAGYYQVNCTVFSEATTITRIIVNPYKNGSSLTRLVDIGVTGSNSAGVTGSIVVYMNGSTDYLELYVYVVGTGSIILNGATDRNCRFNGSMVRSA